MQKTCTRITIRHWWNKLKITQTDRKIYHVLGLEESILLKMTITTQGNLWIQCNSYQNTNGIFHRSRTNNFNTCMETQKTLNSSVTILT